MVIAGEIRRGSISINLIRPTKFIPRLLAEAGGNILVNILSVVLPGWIALQFIVAFALHAPLPGWECLLLYPASWSWASAFPF
jgi:ABC-type uncharacterized transport system permease subunit